MFLLGADGKLFTHSSEVASVGTVSKEATCPPTSNPPPPLPEEKDFCKYAGCTDFTMKTFYVFLLCQPMEPISGQGDEHTKLGLVPLLASMCNGRGHFLSSLPVSLLPGLEVRAAPGVRIPHHEVPLVIVLYNRPTQRPEALTMGCTIHPKWGTLYRPLQEIKISYYYMGLFLTTHSNPNQ